MKLKKYCFLFTALLMLSSNQLSARELADGEWYLKLLLTADGEGLADPYNTLGQLNDALPEYDRDDLPEPGQPFAGNYLSVIFYRPDWETVWESEEESWDMGWEDFNTDYRPISSTGPIAGCDLEHGIETGDEWTFEVRSNDVARALSLTWEGSEGANLERMVLVDLQENVTVPAVIDGEIQQYDFTMNGAVRAFAWRLMSDMEYQALVSNNAVNVSSSSQPAVSSVAKKSIAPGVLSREESPSDNFRITPSMKSGSGWLPKSWNPIEGHDQPVPEGLPTDPLGN